MVTEVKLVQSEKAPLPILVTLLGMVKEVKLEQPEKTYFPMHVTLLGMVREVIFTSSKYKLWAQDRGLESELEKEMLHHAAISLILTLSSLVQSLKAASPMLVTLLEMVTEVKPEQPEKAYFPMLETPLGMVTEIKPEQS